MRRKGEIIVSFLIVQVQTVELFVDNQREMLTDATGFPLDHAELWTPNGWSVLQKAVVAIFSLESLLLGLKRRSSPSRRTSGSKCSKVFKVISQLPLHSSATFFLETTRKGQALAHTNQRCLFLRHVFLNLYAKGAGIPLHMGETISVLSRTLCRR